MQANSRRDPKKFAQRTMAAAIAASAMATFSTGVHAQTTGGGIGAAVNGNANASAGTANQGTAGTAGGTTTSGVAAPNAPSSPVRPGAGPGINNTGSPALGVPRNLQGPIGGSPNGARNANGTTRIPGNTGPAANTAGNPAAMNGANGTQPSRQPGAAANANARGAGQQNSLGASGSAANSRGAGNQRMGQITNYSGSSISFREGANTSQMNIGPNTVIQMDGRNITMRDIPANSQVQVERSPSNPNLVQRIVVVPQGGAGSANAGGSSNSVNTQTGTGSTGSANRSLPSNDLNAATPNGSTRGNDINAPTPNGSLRGNDINSPTPNGSTPNNDINAGTANASTPGNDLNSPTVPNANTSDRALAPGQNPADQPRAPFTRGNDQRLQAGFDEPRSQGANAQGTNRPGQNQTPATDSSQFLGPVTGPQGDVSNSNASGSANSETGANSKVYVPRNPPGIGGDPRVNNANREGGPGYVRWGSGVNQRMGMQLNAAQDGLTVGDVSQQSFAARSGLMSGDRIQSLNGQAVSTPDAFAQALQSSNGQSPMTARVMRNGTPQDISLSLPNGFFNGLNAGGGVGVGGAGANSIGNLPAVGLGGGIGIAADGTPGVNAGGVFVPATGDVQVGANQGQAASANAGAGGGVEPGMNRGGAQQANGRNRTENPAVGTQRTPMTTEALKVPDVDLGWQLKGTPEGVVMSSMVNDGLAAESQFEGGDIIESIDGRPITAPGAVSYELHRHRAGATVDVGILRGGRRMTRRVTLPESHQPLLLNRNESFGAANNAAKDQGGSGAQPISVKPTEESRKTLEEENRALRDEVKDLRDQKKP